MSVTIVRPTDGPLEKLITPIFSHMNLENIAQSYAQRKPVYEVKEVVQLRFAGDKNFSPVFGVHEIYRTDGFDQITYAERFSTQYQAFLSGDAQLADGTPLEKLIEHGITPAYISLCRALKIHTVEALAHLEGANLKASGSVVSNTLKPMAIKFMEDRATGAQALAEIEQLRQELAMLRAGSIVVPEKAPTEEEVNVMISEADEKENLKALIADRSGARPRGNPSLESLREMAAPYTSA